LLSNEEPVYFCDKSLRDTASYLNLGKGKNARGICVKSLNDSTPFFHNGTFLSAHPVAGLAFWFSGENNEYDPGQYRDNCHNVLPFSFFGLRERVCGLRKSQLMDLTRPQVIDNTITMISIDGTTEQLQIGERRSYIVTNELHNIDSFWRWSVGIAILLGIAAYNYANPMCSK
jgi:hypothetical protein